MSSRASPTVPANEAVQPLVGLVLVELEVGRRVERDDRPIAPVGVDPQRDLLGHRAARHEDGRRLAEQLANLGLERGDRAAVAVPVLLEVHGRERGDLGEHVRRRAEADTLEEPVAARAQSLQLLRRDRVASGAGAWSSG